MNSGDCVNIKLQLDNWRGLSAYEVALKNGYKGTEEEWLESLKGRDGGVAMVNSLIPDKAGSVNLTAVNIQVSSEDARTLKEVTDTVDTLANAVKVTDTAINIGGRFLDGARFR